MPQVGITRVVTIDTRLARSSGYRGVGSSFGGAERKSATGLGAGTMNSERAVTRCTNHDYRTKKGSE